MNSIQWGLIIFELVFLSIVLVLFVSIIIGLIMARGVPFVSTPRRKYRQILEASKIKPGEKIYDLGCGKATLLIMAAKEFGATGVGYEISLWPYLWAQFNILVSGAKVKVYMKNFFKADVSDADVIYCYLFPETMDQLRRKFERELSPRTRVVSYGFKMSEKAPAEIVPTRKDGKELERIFVYRFGEGERK